MVVRLARAALRTPAALLITIFLMLAYGLAPRSAKRWRRRIQVAWCRALLWLTGLRVVTHGVVAPSGVTVFCANHVSYLDIIVMSSQVEGVFIAKSEVAGWPLFGRIATLTGTILVDRTPARARAQRAEICTRLVTGDNLILFAEGTSTNGAGVAPFKSTLFDIVSPADDVSDTWVQPVSIAYVRDRSGRPLTGPRRDLYAWHGDMTLAPHLLNVMAMPGAEVRLTLHPPFRAADVGDRKALARRSQDVVAAGVAASFGDAPKTPGAATA